MMLPAVIANTGRLNHALLVLQSSAAQSSLSVLREVIASVQRQNASILLFCLLYPPETLVEKSTLETIQVFDHTGNVPGYSDTWSNPRETIPAVLKGATPGPVTIIIDSMDTLLSDIGSIALTDSFVRELLSIVCSRPDPSRLVLHMVIPCPILPLLLQTSLSATLAYIQAHPPELLMHLAKNYGTPPPASSPAKFWGLFTPFSERWNETDRLVFGPGGEGCGGGTSGEMVLEVLVRSPWSHGRPRFVERDLEGFTNRIGPCMLSDLTTLKGIWNPMPNKTAPDPTQNLSFNLNLTPSQAQSRASVPLPYAHQGKPPETTTSSAEIFYDPDSADDIDDDDPDEDLEI